MSGDHVKWGILGTNFISEVMAKAIQDSTFGQIWAIGSRSLATAKAFAERFSIPTYYDDYSALLLDPQIDAVYIGLPNHLHKEWIIRAAQAGKHILCEKPFVLNSKEANAAIDAVNQAQVVCMEALMYRYHPFIKKLQTLIQDRIIGDIKIMNATYTANIASIANPIAGGSIRNLGCYPISLVRLLANAEPVEQISLGRIDPKSGNDNQASIILKFENDMVAVISTADDIEMVYQFDVYGTEGYLKILTNPWLPDQTNNKMIIYRNDESEPFEMNITADKPLYSYQIDAMSYRILKEDNASIIHQGIPLKDSLGNVAVLEKWVEQVRHQ